MYIRGILITYKWVLFFQGFIMFNIVKWRKLLEPPFLLLEFFSS